MSHMISDADRFIARAAGFAAFAVPALLGILSASPEPYWLDSPEFTAAAQTLGMPHPPGHPLYVLLAKPFTLIPLGGVAFRVSLASAIFGALASFILYHLTLLVIRGLADGLEPWIASTVSLSAAVLAAVAPGWWFQCVRQEVYSLQILLVLTALYPLVHFCLAHRHMPDERLLYLAAFLAGLGLSNHHFIMFAVMPAAIPKLVALSKHKGTRGMLLLLVKLAGAVSAGLLPYLFLPLRSASHAAVALGGVQSMGDFFWVISAKVYQKSMAQQYTSTMNERSMNAVFTMMGQLGPVVVVIALFGFYILLRRRHTRMIGLVMALVAAVSVLLRATMGFDPFNPDYYGYMLPTIAALAIGFAVFAAVFIHVLKENLKVGKHLAVVLSFSLMVYPVYRARLARQEVNLSDFRATRLLSDFSLERAVPGTLVLVMYYNLFFALWSSRFIDGSRPDLDVVNPMFFAYPGYLDATLAADDSLMPLARSMLVHGELTEPAAAALTLVRPLRIEPSLTLSDSVVRYMVPDAPVYYTAPEPLSVTDVKESSPDYLTRWNRFYRALGPSRDEHETWRMLSWCHFQDAIFMARRGDRTGARQAIQMAQGIGNRAPELMGLAAALENGKAGPVDIAPFIPKTNAE